MVLSRRKFAALLVGTAAIRRPGLTAFSAPTISSGRLPDVSTDETSYPTRLDWLNHHLLKSHRPERWRHYEVLFTGLIPHQSNTTLAGRWYAWKRKREGQEPRYFTAGVHEPSLPAYEYHPGAQFNVANSPRAEILFTPDPMDGLRQADCLVIAARNRLFQVLREAGEL